MELGGGLAVLALAYSCMTDNLSPIMSRSRRGERRKKEQEQEQEENQEKQEEKR